MDTVSTPEVNETSTNKQSLTLSQRARYVASVYNRLAQGTNSNQFNGVITPGFPVPNNEQLASLDLSAAKQAVADNINSVLAKKKSSGHQVPEQLDADAANKLADLFVEATVKQDYAKRAELIEAVEALGIDFKPKGEGDSLLAFWSGDYSGYRYILNQKLADSGKSVAIDFDVTGLDFIHALRSELSRYSRTLPEDSVIRHSIQAGMDTLSAYLSSVYATGVEGTAYALSPNGLKLNNYFWLVELPVLRQLQKDGYVSDVKVLFKKLDEYFDKPLSEIGTPISDPEVPLQVQIQRLPEWLQAFGTARKLQQDANKLLVPKLDELKAAIEEYVNTHGDSRKSRALTRVGNEIDAYINRLSSLTKQTSTEQMEYWYEFIKQRNKTGGNPNLESVKQLTSSATVLGLFQGESFKKIIQLLDEIHTSSKKIYIPEPHDIIDLGVNGDFINQAADTLRHNLLPLNLLRNEWQATVSHDIASGKVTLMLENGQAVELQVDTSADQRKQIATLQRYILANFDQNSLPAVLEIAGDQIIQTGREGTATIVAQRIAGEWLSSDLVERRNNANNIANQPETSSPIVSSETGENHLESNLDTIWGDVPDRGQLIEQATVFGEAQGERYRSILTTLDLLWQQQGVDRITTAFDLYKQAGEYIIEHPDSKRNAAIQVLRDRLVEVINKAQAGEVGLQGQVDAVKAQLNTLEKDWVEAGSSAGQNTDKQTTTDDLVNQKQSSFSDLYDQLRGASNKDKHLYFDSTNGLHTNGFQGLFNTLTEEQKTARQLQRETAFAQVRALVTAEYGEAVADKVFSELTAETLSHDGNGIDIRGLKQVHLAIERQLSPTSATLFVWLPHGENVGHAALGIGQGRVQLSSAETKPFLQSQYVSWWPEANDAGPFGFLFTSFNASPHDDLTTDIAHEEEENLFRGLSDRDLERLKRARRFNPELLNFSRKDAQELLALGDEAVLEKAREKGVPKSVVKTFLEKRKDPQLKTNQLVNGLVKSVEQFIQKARVNNPKLVNFSVAEATYLLTDPLAEKTMAGFGIPDEIARFYLAQWNDVSSDQQEVINSFVDAVQADARRILTDADIEADVNNLLTVLQQQYNHAINDSKNTAYADSDGVFEDGRVIRINLEGLDVNAMQREWQSIRSQPDAKYQLLSKNCSTMVARVLKAGGAEKIIGRAWRPLGGIWRPREIFNFAQHLQQAQLDKLAAQGGEDSQRLPSGLAGSVALTNDNTPVNNPAASLSPLKRFFNNELFGRLNERRQLNPHTRRVLSQAVADGTSEAVTLAGEAGRLVGYYHKAESSPAADKKVVLFLHGSGDSGDSQAEQIRTKYQQQGMDILAVNFRGYGDSDGAPSEAGLYQDARTMLKYLMNDRGISPANIIVHGYSMGAPVAADLARVAAEQGLPVGQLLLDRPMPSMSKAITAFGIANPRGITGALAKAVNGQFSVQKNLAGLPKDTPIVLVTDSEDIGNAGEVLRLKLVQDGYNVTGEQLNVTHEDNRGAISELFDKQLLNNNNTASVDPQAENASGLVRGYLAQWQHNQQMIDQFQQRLVEVNPDLQWRPAPQSVLSIDVEASHRNGLCVAIATVWAQASYLDSQDGGSRAQFLLDNLFTVGAIRSQALAGPISDHDAAVAQQFLDTLSQINTGQTTDSVLPGISRSLGELNLTELTGQISERFPVGTTGTETYLLSTRNHTIAVVVSASEQGFSIQLNDPTVGAVTGISSPQQLQSVLQKHLVDLSDAYLFTSDKLLVEQVDQTKLASSDISNKLQPQFNPITTTIDQLRTQDAELGKVTLDDQQFSRVDLYRLGTLVDGKPIDASTNLTDSKTLQQITFRHDQLQAFIKGQDGAMVTKVYNLTAFIASQHVAAGKSADVIVDTANKDHWLLEQRQQLNVTSQVFAQAKHALGMARASSLDVSLAPAAHSKTSSLGDVLVLAQTQATGDVSTLLDNRNKAAFIRELVEQGNASAAEKNQLQQLDDARRRLLALDSNNPQLRSEAEALSIHQVTERFSSGQDLTQILKGGSQHFLVSRQAGALSFYDPSVGWFSGFEDHHALESFMTDYFSGQFKLQSGMAEASFKTSTLAPAFFEQPEAVDAANTLQQSVSTELDKLAQLDVQKGPLIVEGKPISRVSLWQMGARINGEPVTENSFVDGWKRNLSFDPAVLKQHLRTAADAEFSNSLQTLERLAKAEGIRPVNLLDDEGVSRRLNAALQSLDQPNVPLNTQRLNSLRSKLGGRLTLAPGTKTKVAGAGLQLFGLYSGFKAADDAFAKGDLTEGFVQVGAITAELASIPLEIVLDKALPKLGQRLISYSAARSSGRFAALGRNLGVGLSRGASAAAGLVTLPFDIYSAYTAFTKAGEAGLTDKQRQDLYFQGGISVAGATISLGLGVAALFSASAATVAGPIGIAAAVVLIGISQGYTAARRVEDLKEYVEVSEIRAVWEGTRVFFGSDFTQGTHDKLKLNQAKASYWLNALEHAQTLLDSELGQTIGAVVTGNAAASIEVFERVNVQEESGYDTQREAVLRSGDDVIDARQGIDHLPNQVETNSFITTDQYKQLQDDYKKTRGDAEAQALDEATAQKEQFEAIIRNQIKQGKQTTNTVFSADFTENTEKGVMFNLGGGNDSAYGVTERKNMFVFNEGVKQLTGGNKDDTFSFAADLGTIKNYAANLNDDGTLINDKHQIQFHLDGGDGEDTLVLSGKTFSRDFREEGPDKRFGGYIVDLAAGKVWLRNRGQTGEAAVGPQIGSLESIEHTTGSGAGLPEEAMNYGYDDILYGTEGVNTLVANFGDKVFARGGDDVVTITDYATVDGGAGKDIYLVQRGVIDANIDEDGKDVSVIRFDYSLSEIASWHRQGTNLVITFVPKHGSRNRTLTINKVYEASAEGLMLVNNQLSFQTRDGFMLTPQLAQTVGSESIDELQAIKLIARYLKPGDQVYREDTHGVTIDLEENRIDGENLINAANEYDKDPTKVQGLFELSSTQANVDSQTLNSHENYFVARGQGITVVNGELQADPATTRKTFYLDYDDSEILSIQTRYTPNFYKHRNGYYLLERNDYAVVVTMKDGRQLVLNNVIDNTTDNSSGAYLSGGQTQWDFTLITREGIEYSLKDQQRGTYYKPFSSKELNTGDKYSDKNHEGERFIDTRSRLLQTDLKLTHWQWGAGRHLNKQYQLTAEGTLHADKLYGSDQDDILRGYGGADFMQGRDGHDAYVVTGLAEGNVTINNLASDQKLDNLILTASMEDITSLRRGNDLVLTAKLPQPAESGEVTVITREITLKHYFVGDVYRHIAITTGDGHQQELVVNDYGEINRLIMVGPEAEAPVWVESLQANLSNLQLGRDGNNLHALIIDQGNGANSRVTEVVFTDFYSGTQVQRPFSLENTAVTLGGNELYQLASLAIPRNQLTIEPGVASVIDGVNTVNGEFIGSSKDDYVSLVRTDNVSRIDLAEGRNRLDLSQLATENFMGDELALYANLNDGALYVKGKTIQLNNIQHMVGTHISDSLMGNQENNILIGGDGNDRLHGTGGFNTLIGGQGDDTILSGVDADTIIFSKGDGKDVIQSGYSGNTTGDILRLQGISLYDVHFSIEENVLGSALRITFKNQDSDGITIESWEQNEAFHIATDDGSALDRQGIDQLVQALAGFDSADWASSAMSVDDAVTTHMTSAWTISRPVTS
ncbi:alpha/beta fold hydrolase [Zooshikella marina]|uniref:alpha/beta fold hydrolase n=1 Tax=Zooshikella ganghwensis TaxID=202772 RepID=UPI001BAE8B46|nr:alpha/beta fold hydrolase [Zooshikella ganghwensis]MBU2707586.1 alpha/beta fold hydrolase [Zooshikella ganghwensis]